MKIVNNKLEEIKDAKIETIINEVHNEVIKYLKERCENAVVENQLDNKVENLVVEIVPSIQEKCMALYNGKEYEFDWPRIANAFANHVTQSFKDKKWFFTNGIFVSSTIDETRIQTIIHEYLHFLSFNETIESKNNLYHNKRGLEFSIYDEFDNKIDSPYSCGFLNEGLTELLTSKIIKRKPSSYEFNCLIVDLLIMNNHNELIEAYFSEDYEKIVNYKDLFEQQTGCNFELISNNQKYGMGISKERTEAMILSCITYQINSSNSYEELDQIQLEINKILSKYKIFEFKYDIETIASKTAELINEKKQKISNKHK